MKLLNLMLICIVAFATTLTAQRVTPEDAMPVIKEIVKHQLTSPTIHYISCALIRDSSYRNAAGQIIPNALVIAVQYNIDKQGKVTHSETSYTLIGTAATRPKNDMHSSKFPNWNECHITWKDYYSR